MKKIFLLGFVLVLLTGCSQKEQINYDPNAMPGMPCHKMGDTYMGDCEFDEEGNLIEPHSHGISQKKTGKLFSQDVDELPLAKPSEVVELKNGETYTMTAGLVKEEIGNTEIRRLAYNGQIPGPLLKVEKNSTIKVEFKNELEIETTIHSHGLRQKNAFDGVPDLTQKAIQPGESFTYELEFPDEGIYWYHPHVREDYTQELGLYGNFLVEPQEKNYWNTVDREEALILDDLLVNENEPSFSQDHSDHALMGRFGNIMLINNEEHYALKAKRNETLRLYLTNAANTRTFNFAIQDTELKVVGGDLGRVEKEYLTDTLMLGPGERYIVEIQFAREGNFEIQNRKPESTDILGGIFVEGETNNIGDFKKLREFKEGYVSIREEIQSWLSKKADKSLRLSVEMKGRGGHMSMNHSQNKRDIEWEDDMVEANQASNSENTLWKLIDEESKKANMDIDWKFKKGDLVKIKIFNDPHSMHPMQHPIHFHGQRFLILTRDGKLNENFQWKDTTLIKNGETVEILVEMSNPGKWMAHCHIAEHMHSGMMLEFDVLD